MKKVFAICVVIFVTTGCSSDDNDVPGTVGNGGGGNNGDSLTSIASTDASGSPSLLNIEGVQNSLDAITTVDPVRVESGDTVTSLLSKAGL